jgi:hypothetical protein
MQGIWIRSQDKGLYFCIGFDSPVKKNYAPDKSKPFVITGYVSGEMQPFLGWYATEERALQVLDKIQKQLIQAMTGNLIIQSPGIEDGIINANDTGKIGMVGNSEKITYIPGSGILFY